MFGILRASCVYVPIEAHTPAQRVTQLLELSGSQALLTSERTLSSAHSSVGSQRGGNCGEMTESCDELGGASIDRVGDFRGAIMESRKRPNAYFGYAVPIPLNVKPATADKFFKELEYD